MRTLVKTLAAAAAALGLVIGATACATPSESEPATLRLGVGPDQISGYNPLVTSLYPYSASLVYEPLFARDSNLETGGFEPKLATGYERSDDWKTLTITLRDDVTFVDGERLTADAVKTYLEGMYASDDWWLKADWEKLAPTLTVEDDTTLVISSENPISLRFRSPVALLFSAVVIASPRSLDDLEATATEPLGTGPYVVESSTPEVGAVYTRNDDYWNSEAYPFDSVELKIFDDEVAALNALKSGQIDATSFGQLANAVEAEKNGFTLSFHKDIYDGRPELYIADRAGTLVPALADKRVRQAIALAFDREAIDETLEQGFGFTSTQPFVEGQDEYVPGGDDRYSYDPERARELLAEAGYADGFDLKILSTPFLAINTYEPVVAQYLGDIGIRVTFETLETGAFFGAATSGTEHPVIMYGEYSISVIPVFIAADAVFNPFKIQDPVVDALWAKVNEGPDDEARSAAQELGAYVLDQAILIPFAAQPGVWAAAPGFTIDNRDGGPQIERFGIED